MRDPFKFARGLFWAAVAMLAAAMMIRPAIRVVMP
jgi:hypothetical protein